MLILSIRQILTYKDGSSAEKANHVNAELPSKAKRWFVVVRWVNIAGPCARAAWLTSTGLRSTTI